MAEAPENLPSVPVEKEAEIVPSVAEETVARGKIFAPVLVEARGKRKRRIVHKSHRESKFVNRLLSTGNLDIACQEIGVSRRTGKRYLKRKDVWDLIQQKTEEAALAAGTDLKNQIAWLRKVRDGEIVLDPKDDKLRMDAAKELRKFVSPGGGGKGVTVNVQQNNVNATVPSPYADMSLDATLAAIRERLDAVQGRGASPA